MAGISFNGSSEIVDQKPDKEHVVHSTGGIEKTISLAERADAQAVTANIQELGVKVLQEKGKLEGFMKLMQRS